MTTLSPHTFGINPMIKFSNPGEIDILALTTLGVNAKSGDSPIGYFGTGLKYAIAVLLRNGQGIEVWSGQMRVRFTSAISQVRGKDFGFVYMSTNDDPPLRLGFTTELGKNWTLAHAYRELHSNCLDEGGTGGVETGAGHRCVPKAGETNIFVAGTEFAATHRDRYTFLLDPSRPRIASTEGLEIYPGRSKTIFYRGIAACALAQESLHTYNITAEHTLTEDRTLAVWDAQWHIARILAGYSAIPSHIISDAVGAPEKSFEAGLNYSYSTPSQEFLATTRKVMELRPAAANRTAIAKLYATEGSPEPRYVDVPMTAEWTMALHSAIAFCEACGFAVSRYKIRVVASLGENVLAMASHGTIYLTPVCIERTLLREALIEEFLHLDRKVGDFTREMQDLLFAQIVRLGTALQRAEAVHLDAIAPPVDDAIPF